MEMQNVKNQVTKVFTPARLKKAAAFAVLVGIVTAGGAYYHHSQAEARSLAEKQARAEMVAAQAEQRGIVLLDEAKVRSIAAEAIGKSESELDFRTVYLTAKDHGKDGKHGKKHRDGRHDREYHGHNMYDHDGHPGMMPQTSAPNADTAGTSPALMADGSNALSTENTVRQGFRPVYKVKCYAGNVEYKLRIDAVTGTVLSSKAEMDDDMF